MGLEVRHLRRLDDDKHEFGEEEGEGKDYYCQSEEADEEEGEEVVAGAMGVVVE